MSAAKLDDAGAATAAPEQQVRDLVSFALRGLPPMRCADGMYCLEVHAGEMQPRGRSIRYSAMVALGLLRAASAGYELDVDLDALLDLLFAEAADPSLAPGDAGLLLWLDRRAGRDNALALIDACQRRLGESEGGLAARQGMEVAWIALGAVESVAAGLGEPAERLLALAREELRRRVTPSGLLRHDSAGWRGRFPNFATQIYGTLALAALGRRGDDEALAFARGVGDAILALQRPDGGWPWIFDAVRGTVAEPYEVYVVHQDAMAPMGLFELYGATGDDRYRRAAVRGLRWIYGENDLGVSMFDEADQILYRSIRRTAPWSRAVLAVNTATAYAGRAVASGWRGTLELNRTDRPYHLGWVLEAWCGREHLAAGPGESP
jgi:hypothetical protein